MKNILIAEDDYDSATMLTKALVKFRLTQILSFNRKAAWDVLGDNPDIDLLKPDVRMPVMDGRQLIERVRNREAYSELPIIIMSAQVGIKEISDLIAHGATEFMAKPVTLSELKKHIDRNTQPSSC